MSISHWFSAALPCFNCPQVNPAEYFILSKAATHLGVLTISNMHSKNSSIQSCIFQSRLEDWRQRLLCELTASAFLWVLSYAAKNQDSQQPPFWPKGTRLVHDVLFCESWMIYGQCRHRINNWSSDQRRQPSLDYSQQVIFHVIDQIWKGHLSKWIGWILPLPQQHTTQPH